MVVHKRLLVLANSVKKGYGRCLAGREIVTAGEKKYRIGPWLRPTSGHGEGELLWQERLYLDGKPVCVMDFADVPLGDKLDDPCQPENWRISSSERWRNVNASYKRPSLSCLEESPPNLWLQPGEQPDRVTHEYLTNHPPKQSLYIIHPEEFRLSLRSYSWYGSTKKKRRCLFRYKGVVYDMGITDPVITERYEAQIPAPGRPALEVRLPCHDDLFICVSLANVYQGHHYKVVATVFEGSE